MKAHVSAYNRDWAKLYQKRCRRCEGEGRVREKPGPDADGKDNPLDPGVLVTCGACDGSGYKPA